MKSSIARVFQGLLAGLAVCALMLAGVVPAQAREPVAVLHVFLAAGQSNMSGRGLPAGGTGDPADPRIFQYGAKERTFRPATVPLDMHDSATGLSPATAFARNYLATQPANAGVLLIPAAHGGTGFTRAAGTLTWSPGAASAPEFDLPAQAVTQTLRGIAAAQAAGYTVELKGILWHQGENNAALSAAGYSAELDALIGFFRARLAAPKLPFVVGRMAPEGIAAVPGRDNADRSHLETPSRVPSTGFAPSRAGGTNPGDATHFSRTGIEYLGTTYLSGYRQAAAAPPAGGSLTAPVPALDGAARVGSVLTAVPGTWGPAPVTLSYRWYRSHLPISGATAPRYKVRTADLGRTLTVKVTGARTGYPAVSKTSTGRQVAKGALTAPVPAITGTARVGATLTAVPGTWGPAPVTLTYRWYRSHLPISGATSPTYKVRSGDLGRTLTVKVTGAKTAYTTTTRTSAGTSLIAKGSLTAPVPAITGTARVGATLTAVPGTWGPAPVTLSYRWHRSHLPISDATGPTYRVRSGDLGRTLTVKVTGTRTGYTTTTRTSAGTALIAKGSLTTAVPAITGTARVGAILTAVPGTWGPAPVTLTYRWHRSHLPISDATSPTYRVRSADQGRTITVKVTGSRTGYTTTTKTSAGKIAAG